MHKYTGLTVKVFLAYKDADKDATLVAEPGGEYNIVPVGEARPVPEGFEEVKAPPARRPADTTQTDSDGE